MPSRARGVRSASSSADGWRLIRRASAAIATKAKVAASTSIASSRPPGREEEAAEDRADPEPDVAGGLDVAVRLLDPVISGERRHQ